MADVVGESEALAAHHSSGARAHSSGSSSEYLQTAPHLIEEMVPPGMHRMEDAAWERQRWIDSQLTNARILKQRDAQVLEFRRGLAGRAMMPGPMPL